MTNAPIRIVVLLAICSLTGILVTQVYWADQAITSQEKQFSHSVQMALLSVVESLCEQEGTDFPSNDPIEQVSNNYFIVRTKNKIALGSLEYLLKAEFQKRSLDQNFEFGVYDCTSEEMVYGNFVNLGAPDKKPTNRIPELTDYDTHFGVFFPDMDMHPLWGIDLWKFTTGITVIVLIFFGYTLFVILKQKRLSVIQRDFVNNITHEFKTPIATLKVASDVLAQSQTLSDPKRLSQYTGIIQSESIRLEKHVTQLLNSAFLEHGTKTDLKSVDPSKLVSKVVRSFNISDRNVDLSIQCDETLKVLADSYLLETAIYNLIDNAIKYGNGTVSVCTKDDGNRGIITVCDNGQGIPLPTRKNIFKKFYRINEGDQHNVKGFGLGLFVVKNALEQMGGTVSFECGNETCFTLTLKKQ